MSQICTCVQYVPLYFLARGLIESSNKTVANVATISSMTQPDIDLLLHEHGQLGVRPIPLKLIFAHVFHKDKTILLLRLLGFLLWSSLLALGVVLLVALPGDGSTPTRHTG